MPGLILLQNYIHRPDEISAKKISLGRQSRSLRPIGNGLRPGGRAQRDLYFHLPLKGRQMKTLISLWYKLVLYSHP